MHKNKENSKNKGANKVVLKLIRNLCICTLAVVVFGWVASFITMYIDYTAEKKVQQIIAEIVPQQATPKEELGGNTLTDIEISEDGVSKEDVSEVAEKGANAVVSITKYDIDPDNAYNFVA